MSVLGRFKDAMAGAGSPSSAANTRSVHYAVSPLLASRTPPWRSRFVMLLVAVGFAILMGRAVYVQLLATEFYQAKGEEKFLHQEALAASRGRVLDRNGKLLAISVQLPSVQVDGKLFAATPAERRALAKALNMSETELNARLDKGAATVVLRRHVEESAWAQVQALKLKGVHARLEFKRQYPEGEAAAHVVGFTGVEDQGLAGAELAFEKTLIGAAGARTVMRDRLGRVIEQVGEAREPFNGQDVVLSIDSRIQSYAFQKLRDTVKQHEAKNGSVVVIDTLRGEVLALANYPGFDPAEPGNRRGDKLRNIAVTDIFEPGSTMKPFVAAMALDSRRWTPQSMIDTAPGRLTIHGATISDSHPHGMLSLAEVIQKSSNVGTVKLAQQMPMRDMWSLYSDIGMGQKPQLDFPGVAHGRLRPYKTWRPIEHATMSYGYGLSASLFQIAQAYTSFARDGQLVPVSLIKRELEADLLQPGQPGQPGQSTGSTPVAAQAPAAASAGQRVMSARTAVEVRKMLGMAVSKGGTAPLAQESTLGYSVGGKTGTARIHAKGAYTNRHRAFFVGLAPLSNPRVVVAVMVAEPSKGQFYGGQVAAPLFGQVMQQTLRLMNVAPDMDVATQIKAKPAVAERESF